MNYHLVRILYYLFQQFRCPFFRNLYDSFYIDGLANHVDNSGTLHQTFHAVLEVFKHQYFRRVLSVHKYFSYGLSHF